MQIDEDKMAKLEITWRNKMINARINGFIVNFYNRAINLEGDRCVGGSTLRDDLYVITSKANNK